jgi:hypothetical protein
VRLSFLRRVALFVVAAIALVSGLGCASMNRENYIHQKASEIIYERPMPEVWTAAQQMLTEDGYSGRQAPEGWVYITEWKENTGGSLATRTYTRYLVEGRPLGQTKSSIRFVKATRSAGASSAGMGNADPNTHAGMSNLSAGGTSESKISSQNMAQSQEGIGGKTSLASGTRDLEMEWRLLQRIDPQRAKSIEAEAVRKYP